MYFVVCSSEVMMKPTGGYHDPEGQDGAGFAAMWRYCQLFALEAVCVAHDPDNAEMIDLSLDVMTARDQYLWM